MSGRFLRLAAALMLMGCVVSGPGVANAEQNPAQRAKRFLAAPPGSQMYPLKVGAAYPPYRPAQAVAAYDWGYFGARTSPSCVKHIDAHGEPRGTKFPAGF